MKNFFKLLMIELGDFIERTGMIIIIGLSVCMIIVMGYYLLINFMKGF